MSRAIRRGFLEAAEHTATLLTAPRIAEAWERPSALAEFSVSGLCGHLANQVFSVTAERVRGENVLDEPPIPLLQHYIRAQWMDAPVDAPINVGIRETGQRIAGSGPTDLIRRLHEHIEGVRELIVAQPEDRVVGVGGRWNLMLEDYLITRMMEIAVHSDDVAASVGIDTPSLPPSILDPVVDLLTKLSMHKHGQAAMLRALTRSERAPADITAF